MNLTYLKALLKRADTQALTQFNPPLLPQKVYVEHLSPDPEHYQAYCENVGWNVKHQPHPCYLQTRATNLQMQCLADKGSPFPLLGLIHRTNEIIQQTQVDVSKPAKLTARFHDVQAHVKGWEIGIKVTAEQQGQDVYQAIGRYLIRINAPHVERKVDSSFPPKAQWEQFNEVTDIDVPEGIGRRYAKLSGDYNPIHLSRFSARPFGFDKTIAHGMWTLAKCVSEIEKHVRRKENAADPISQIYCEFKRPVFLPALTHLLMDNPEQHTATFALVGNEKTAPHILGTVS
ncbi:hypothetical protein CA267_015700 [Alteromonas pelagimontana]|uniref:MaoC-like domain-containing protein n=1 Tax=Alteromonas pelagimontana TaxID=1858656 RepID=A0A6M4MHJ2_9ALTE|nr:MaoC/PaaZ C-terminal domain-containing protein [Alteromonas pelagimontana]QJR82090.1 hypothetical protein CA267_015700 [Alteromonas pelagimontana]